MSNYNNLLNNLESLKLEKFRTFLPNYIDQVANENISFSDALLKLTQSCKKKWPNRLNKN